jgi:hypothetical protein
MPATITAQDGAQIKQDTKISVSGCPGKTGSRSRVKILAHRVVGHTLMLKVQTPAAGRVSAAGSDLRPVVRRLGKASTTTLDIALTRDGLRALRTHHLLKIVVRVRFVPNHTGASSSTVSAVIRPQR